MTLKTSNRSTVNRKKKQKELYMRRTSGSSSTPVQGVVFQQQCEYALCEKFAMQEQPHPTLLESHTRGINGALEDLIQTGIRFSKRTSITINYS